MKSKLNEEKRPFFVYGTLLPGQPNAFLWQGTVTEQQPATLAGCALYDRGSYPMLVETGDECVHGMLLHIAEAEYEAVVARLDDLEGCTPDQSEDFGYSRVIRTVQIENASPEHDGNGRFLSAWVYIGQEATVCGLPSIPGGDWVSYAADTFQEIDLGCKTWRLNMDRRKRSLAVEKRHEFVTKTVLAK